MPVSVYWIRRKDHTDIFSQGYIGVSNNTEKRFAKHKTHVNNSKHINPLFENAVKKYGWDNLVKKVILIADKEIGWNIAPGGGMPNVKFGDKNSMRNPIIAAKTAATKKGIATRGFGWKHSEETRKKLSKNAGNKGVGTKVTVNGISFISQTAAAKYFDLHIRTFKKRFKLGIL